MPRIRPQYLLLFSTLVLAGLLLLAAASHSQGDMEEATFVGSQTCMSAGCHADAENEIYAGADAFLATMHANTHEAPSPSTVLIDAWFARDSILRYTETTGDTVSIALSKGGSPSSYRAQIRVSGRHAGSTPWMDITYTYGGNGWIQRYLVRIDNSFYVLPFQYILPSYGARTDSGQYAERSRLHFLDGEDWYVKEGDGLRLRDRGSREFLQASWDNRCSGCHTTLSELDTLPAGDGTAWSARWFGSTGDSALRDKNLMIGCESCHGPGSKHVADPSNDAVLDEISPARWDRAGASFYATDRKLDLCNQCHNRHVSSNGAHEYPFDDDAERIYLPGLDLQDFIADALADADFWPDGVSAASHRQSGQDYKRSGHYSNHVFTNGCFDCHTPHGSSTFPFQLNRDWYTLKTGEGCVAYGCHNLLAQSERGPGGVRFNVHTKHPVSVSACVNCHYTRTSTFTFANGTLEFSDHSDQVIRPTATLKYKDVGPSGMLNTCAAGCHRNGFGDRNSPSAFDNGVSVDTALRAPDYGIVDQNVLDYREETDIALAESLWAGYKRLHPQFVTSVRLDDASSEQAGVGMISPNPVSDRATIYFSVGKRSSIRLEIYDAGGRLVRVIADGLHEPGRYRDTWDCVDEAGAPVAAGTYFVRLTGDGFVSSRKVAVAR